MGRIVVGVDGSSESFSAVEWAAHEAKLRGDKLVLVTAWHLPATSGLAGMVTPGVDWSFLEEAAREVLATARRFVHEDGVEVEELAIQDHPVRALLEAAGWADLLVVGCRGLGGFSGLLLGSVSQAVLHHAPCPVTVVPTKPAHPHGHD
ncbi:MAG TPA: universal stress protein [Actinomycetota bacterium]|nr:universal stress protein [Actinomycetota bacterium]